MDQTANLCFDDLERRLYNSKVLVIGSGQDIDGRGLKDEIDNSERWDYVLRLNKLYGNTEDVGTRCDIFVTRWSQWISEGSQFIDQETLRKCLKVIILNQHVNYSKTERLLISKELCLEHVSAGPQAVHYLLNRGCRHIDLVGFGYKDGKFMEEKIYCNNSKNYPDGMKDENPLYDWKAERQWLINQPQVHFI